VIFRGSATKYTKVLFWKWDFLALMAVEILFIATEAERKF